MWRRRQWLRVGLDSGVACRLVISTGILAGFIRAGDEPWVNTNTTMKGCILCTLHPKIVLYGDI